jgi:hypothetical protein
MSAFITVPDFPNVPALPGVPALLRDGTGLLGHQSPLPRMTRSAGPGFSGPLSANL